MKLTIGVLLLVTLLTPLGAIPTTNTQIGAYLNRVENVWYTFPTSINNNPAWVTYNHGFAKVAQEDHRSILVRITVPFKSTTEFGMPSDEEHGALIQLEAELYTAFSKYNSLYVGRITVAGSRYLYFYTTISNDKTEAIINSVSDSSGYSMVFDRNSDPKKSVYWSQLFPTPDDWQVIQDLQLLETLSEYGDINSKKRLIFHGASFKDKRSAKLFTTWVTEQNYSVLISEQDAESNEYWVRYSHSGTLKLSDITRHSVLSNRKARELGGIYDGWETSIEK